MTTPAICVPTSAASDGTTTGSVLGGSPAVVDPLWKRLGIWIHQTRNTRPYPRDWVTGQPLTTDHRPYRRADLHRRRAALPLRDGRLPGRCRRRRMIPPRLYRFMDALGHRNVTNPIGRRLDAGSGHSRRALAARAVRHEVRDAPRRGRGPVHGLLDDAPGSVIAGRPRPRASRCSRSANARPPRSCSGTTITGASARPRRRARARPGGGQRLGIVVRPVPAGDARARACRTQIDQRGRDRRA